MSDEHISTCDRCGDKAKMRRVGGFTCGDAWIPPRGWKTFLGRDLCSPCVGEFYKIMDKFVKGEV